MKDNSARRMSLGTRFVLVAIATSVAAALAMALIARQSVFTSAEENLVAKARAITNEAENARVFMAKLRSTHNAFDDQRLLEQAKAAVAGASTKQEIIDRVRKTPLYATIPVVAAWTVAQTNAEKSGYRFKVPSFNPRNPLNAPDPVEAEMLTELAQGKLPETWRIDQTTNTLRFMRPVTLGEECMLCHGAPEKSLSGDGKDPLGLPMENWKVGEQHGAFEVIADLAPVQAAMSTTTVEMALVGLVSMGVLAGLLVLLSRKLITRPLERAVDVLRRVAQGDLRQRLDLHTRDEIGDLAVALNGAVGGMERALTDVRQAAEGVTIASRELSSAASALSDSTVQQANNIQDTVASVTQVTAATRQSAEDAKKTTTIAATTRDRAEEGGEVVRGAVEAIVEANKASRQIVEITQTIDDIAAQTNLLALNATVEAARAGEHGRGFAVVAGEVRALAMQTAEAARRIQTLVDETVEKVDLGAQMAAKSRAALGDIVSSVQEASSTVGNIAISVQEQAKGLEQVNQAVDRINLLVQNSSSQAQQLAATASSLDQNATTLQTLVRRFEISRAS